MCVCVSKYRSIVLFEVFRLSFIEIFKNTEAGTLKVLLLKFLLSLCYVLEQKETFWPSAKCTFVHIVLIKL
ncbi:hypothetical protein JTE90_009448 [Oedothorax gibbosus]|uniref:Uncharacterized protein n=1 Tax=Oedothorax gibbosus TaxID=931172 RepID=A0AAV6VSE8_9ARAC|nr:hypothetical protein JTE90_009448 [Oedothorax gibbosus]